MTLFDKWIVMAKFIFLIIFLTTLINAKPFNQQIIMIEPVSWEELQKLEFNDLKSKEELNLSNTCPTELASYVNLEIKGTFFKEILWTQYFWTQFENSDGKICVIKHDTFDFFSEQPEEPPLKTPKYEILNENQASLLLNATNSIGFDDFGIETLKRHVHFHNQAVKNKPYQKYGGLTNMARFSLENPRETKYVPPNDEERKMVDANGVVSYKTLDPITVFESKYHKKTLDKLRESVKKNNDLKEDSIYPFNSFEELLIHTGKEAEATVKK